MLISNNKKIVLCILLTLFVVYVFFAVRNKILYPEYTTCQEVKSRIDKMKHAPSILFSEKQRNHASEQCEKLCRIDNLISVCDI